MGVNDGLIQWNTGKDSPSAVSLTRWLPDIVSATQPRWLITREQRLVSLPQVLMYSIFTYPSSQAFPVKDWFIMQLQWGFLKLLIKESYIATSKSMTLSGTWKHYSVCRYCSVTAKYVQISVKQRWPNGRQKQHIHSLTDAIVK